MAILATFFINLALRFYYLVAAVICFALYRLWGFPLFFTWIALGLWALSAVLVTCGLSFANKASNKISEEKQAQQKEKKNLNPYSAKNEDYLVNYKKPEE